MDKPLNNKNLILLRQYKDTLSLDRRLFEVAIGVLLGDACLQTQDGGKSYRLKFSQSLAHQAYLFHLHETFAAWTLSPPHYHGGRRMWSFQTVAHPDFVVLKEFFTVPHLLGKQVDADFVELCVTPRALAYWFMDDGGRACYSKDYERRGVVFNTQGFNVESVKHLVQGLRTKYSFDCWAKPNKNEFVIVISARDHGRFLDLVAPYILPSMEHRIPFFSSRISEKELMT